MACLWWNAILSCRPCVWTWRRDQKNRSSLVGGSKLGAEAREAAGWVSEANRIRCALFNHQCVEPAMPASHRIDPTQSSLPYTIRLSCSLPWVLTFMILLSFWTNFFILHRVGFFITYSLFLIMTPVFILSAFYLSLYILLISAVVCDEIFFRFDEYCRKFV